MVNSLIVNPICLKYQFNSVRDILNKEIIKEMGKFWEDILEIRYSKRIGKKVNRVLTYLIDNAIFYTVEKNKPFMIDVKVNNSNIIIKVNSNTDKKHYKFLYDIFKSLNSKNNFNKIIQDINKNCNGQKELLLKIARLVLDTKYKLSINYNDIKNILSMKVIITL